MKYTNPTKVITGPNTRWSYANVWEAKSINGGAPKFSVSLIIPKSDTRTVEKIKAAIEAAYKEGESKLKGNGRSVPALSAIKNPLREGYNTTKAPRRHTWNTFRIPERNAVHHAAERKAAVIRQAPYRRE